MQKGRVFGLYTATATRLAPPGSVLALRLTFEAVLCSLGLAIAKTVAYVASEHGLRTNGTTQFEAAEAPDLSYSRLASSATAKPYLTSLWRALKKGYGKGYDGGSEAAWSLETRTSSVPLSFYDTC